MKSRLKNLYTYLIANRKHQINGWHSAYCEFYAEVEKNRNRIQSGEKLSETDEEFLRGLLYDKSNGIASRGQSVLSREQFQAVIKNTDFLTALEQLILTPNQESWSKFASVWSDQAKSNNPVLVNRVAAACTLDVSTTVDSAKFNRVFHWLEKEKIIQEYPSDRPTDWFSKNTYLMSLIREAFAEELENGETDKFYLSQFVWELYVNLANPFSLKKQIIKYGAPGTGKTYLTRQQTALQFDIWKEEFAPGAAFKHESQIEFVQFHPSFSYEDFMEGLRPVLDNSGNAQLTLQNGVFKAFCINAGKWEKDVFDLELDQDWEKLTIADLLPHRDQLSGEHWQYIFEISDSKKLISDAVPPFYFIIDEVNRAELSRVFGELMYCLEYRGVKGLIKTQYANLNNNDTGMLQTELGWQFFIPSNIYLIGTMNTIDRSVESFDFALRRRFIWEEVQPDAELLEYHLNQHYKKWEPLAGSLEKLNDRISKEPLLGADYRIGHAYLMNLKYPKDLSVTEVRESVWEDAIRPLLQEYLRGTGKESDLLKSFGKAFGL